MIGTGGNERSNAAMMRLVLRALLFGDKPVPGWRDEAACAEIGPEVFYPEHSRRAS